MIFLTRSTSSLGVLRPGSTGQRIGDLMVGLILAVGAAVFIGMYPHAMGLGWGGH